MASSEELEDVQKQLQKGHRSLELLSAFMRMVSAQARTSILLALWIKHAACSYLQGRELRTRQAHAHATYGAELLTKHRAALSADECAIAAELLRQEQIVEQIMPSALPSQCGLCMSKWPQQHCRSVTSLTLPRSSAL